MICPSCERPFPPEAAIEEDGLEFCSPFCHGQYLAWKHQQLPQPPVTDWPEEEETAPVSEALGIWSMVVCLLVLLAIAVYASLKGSMP